MITLTIKGKKYKLPTNGNEVSLLHGIETKKLLNDKPKLKDKRNIISVLTGCPRNDLIGTNADVIDALFNSMSFLNKGGDIFFHPTLNINKCAYGVNSIDKMNLQEYIILTTNLRNADDNIHQLASCLVRPIVKAKRSIKNRIYTLFARLVTNRYKLYTPVYLTSYEVDKYKGKVDEQLLVGISYFYIKQLINASVLAINNVTSKYPKIYGGDTDEAHELNKKLHKHLYKNNKTKIKEKVNILADYGLYNLLSTLCKDNEIRINKWLTQPWQDFLDYATHIIKKSEVEYQNQVEQANNLRLKHHK